MKINDQWLDSGNVLVVLGLRNGNNMNASLILPCYNEEDSLSELMAWSKNLASSELEIVFVDKGNQSLGVARAFTESSDQGKLSVRHVLNYGMRGVACVVSGLK